MRRIIGLFMLVTATMAAHAAVTPVVFDRPLALRSNPPATVTPAPGQPSSLDVWLNVRINSDNSGQVQNEQQIVVNSSDPNNLVAVWRDFRLGYRRVGVGYSLDAGWTYYPPDPLARRIPPAAKIPLIRL